MVPYNQMHLEKFPYCKVKLFFYRLKKSIPGDDLFAIAES